MLRDDLIVLGLRSGLPAATSTTPEAATVSTESLRAPVERLVTMLGAFVAAGELADDGSLRDRIEACRKTVATATNAEALSASINACCDACRIALASLSRQRAEQKKEIASLVGMVREALAIVSGDGQSFNHHLGHSMARFEALVRIDDVRLLKQQLVHEIGSLREIAVERQKVWESTCENFGRRVETLERQLTLTKEEARLDPLTRILNRGGFDRACRDWLAGDHRQFAMAMVDVDDFKTINDTHGHTVGDHALIAVAQALKNSVRLGSDLAARIGGDEFAVLITDLNLRQAESRMRMLASSLSAVTFNTPTAARLRITVSCGVAECSAGDTTESLMERADAALYEAKRLGKNRVVGKAKPTLRDLLEQ